MLKTAKVIFEDPQYNYNTTVNGELTDEEIKKYFENKFFNVGSYPKEIFKKCIKCEVSKYNQ